jgi:Zn-dependent protease
MNQQFGPLLYTISIWALPAIIAITFHEAAHGFAARMLGDDTAWRLGRAVFNLLPLPPLDGGRIAVGLLPNALASPLARLERYGMIILIGLLFILPMIGAQIGLDLNVVSQSIATVTDAVISVILRITGHS